MVHSPLTTRKWKEATRKRILKMAAGAPVNPRFFSGFLDEIGAI
jgi:hypothetical protein